MTDAFRTFFLPGPTAVRPEVLQAMARPMMSHRSRQFEQLFARLQEGLQAVFRTRRPVYVSSSSATGLMEGAVRCAPDGPILCLVGGAFGERFFRIAQQSAREADLYEVALGQLFDLNEVERRLRERRYSAVTVVHSESSTGVLTDVARVAELAHRHGAAVIVDAVTSIAGAPVETDAWQLDFVLTGSQKALALPPGLAFGVASERFVEGARTREDRGMYFDLVEFETMAAKRQTPNTPALPLLYALEAQLDRIAKEGIEARWARHAAMREAAEQWVDECAERMGRWFRMLPPAGSRSPTVSTICLPQGAGGRQLVSAMSSKGYTITTGYGSLADRSFRIGHMGDHTVDDLDECLTACEETLHELMD
jgi:aspartate aminotransferase-like enzyme